MRRTSRRLFNANVFCACTTMFLIGTFFALSVFNRPLELYNEAAFGNGVLARSMGMLSIFSAITMVGSSLYLQNDSPTTTKSIRLRRISILGVTAFSSFYLASCAAYYGLPGLLRASIALLGVGGGVFYLLGLEIAAAWSSNLGFGIGSAMASFAAGSSVASLAYDFVIRALGVVGALTVCTTFWVVTGSLCLPWIVWPDDSIDSKTNAAVAGHRLSWPDLFASRSFYLFFVACFMAQGSYGPLYAYFFSASYRFPDAFKPTICFAVMQCFGVVSRLVGGLFAEKVGSRLLLTILFAVQTVAFLLITVTTSFAGFLACAGVLFCCFSALASDLAVFCRDVFSPANAATVFGMACGLAIGVGEAFSIVLFPVMGATFKSYYLCLALLSGIGLLCAALTQREAKAFRETLENGDVLEWVPAPAPTIDEEKPLIRATNGIPIHPEDEDAAFEEDDEDEYEYDGQLFMGSYKAALVVESPKFITQSPASFATSRGFGSIGSTMAVVKR